MYLPAYNGSGTKAQSMSAAPSIAEHKLVQKWGNSLAVRITGTVADAAGFVQGLPITAEVVDGGVMLRVSGQARMSLTQMLGVFEPGRHGVFP